MPSTANPRSCGHRGAETERQDVSARANPTAAAGSGGILSEGTVIRSTGSWYDVETSTGVVACRVRGKFRLEASDETNPVVIGDQVEIRRESDETGLIVGVHDRRNRIVRRAAGRRVGREHTIVANVDAAWIVQSVLLPKVNPGFIDRFIVMSTHYGIDVGIIVNKTDLIKDDFSEAIDYWTDLYRNLGFPVLRTSAVTGEGVDAVAARLAGRTSVFVGPSGVGKSTLLNRIEPGLGLRIGDVSARTGKGTHTTTHAELHQLSFGGFVADTPGLREYGLVDIEPDMLSHYFVEFEPLAPECRYPNCSHDHEPGCRVKEAIENGEISAERYESYLNMLFSLRQGEKDVGR